MYLRFPVCWGEDMSKDDKAAATISLVDTVTNLAIVTSSLQHDVFRIYNAMTGGDGPKLDSDSYPLFPLMSSKNIIEHGVLDSLHIIYRNISDLYERVQVLSELVRGEDR